MGLDKSLLDPVMFLVFDKEVTREDEIRRPSGIAVTHVDDVLHAGNDVQICCCKAFDDLCLEVKSLSSKYGKSTKSDLRSIHRKIVLLKADGCTSLAYPKMGNTDDWVLVGHGDAVHAR